MEAAQEAGGGWAGRSPAGPRGTGQRPRAGTGQHSRRASAGEGPLPADTAPSPDTAPAPDAAAPQTPDRARGCIRGLAIALLLLALTLRLRPDPGDLQKDPLLRRLAANEATPTLLRGQVLEEPRRPPPAPPGQPHARGSGGGAAGEGPCKVLIETGDGRSELALNPCRALRPGWRVQASGTLQRLRAAPHPLLAGPAERLAKQGVHTRLRVEQLQVLERRPTPILDLRQRIAGRLIAAAGPERGGLLAALVLGSAVVPLPAALRESFRAAGLSHALAASGFHLTVLLGVVTTLARPLGRPLRLALAAAAMLGFLLLAGPQGSVVRAVLMGAVAVLALEAGRRARPLPLLLTVVVAMLALQPRWLHDVGFQLSVVATAGLLISATPLEQAIAARWPRRRSGQPGWGQTWMAAALAVPLAASLWTLPLQLLHFGVVPLYAVPANLAAGPLLTPLTLAAMVLALVALLLPPLLSPLLLPVDPVARLLLAIADRFAQLPMAQMQTGRPLPWLVALFSLALLPWLLPTVRRRWRAVAAVLLAVVVGLHLQLLWADQLLLVHQGGAGGGVDLLLARHQGRGGLISSRSDAYSCTQARQLAAGLGLARYDWLLLLDAVAAEDPGCWQKQAALVVAYGDGSVPLAAGERLHSPGLAVQALTMDSHALRLQLGRQEWLLLPDRAALTAWRQLDQRPPAGVWLGFRPRAAEQRALTPAGMDRRWRWWSGEPDRLPPPSPWRASGDSGSLHASGA